MASTGEVGCLGDSFDQALITSVISVGNDVPAKRVLISSGNALQKADLLDACRLLVEHGYELYATGGTCRYLYENNIPSMRVLWPTDKSNPVLSGIFPQVLDLIHKKQVDLVINIPKNFTDMELDNGYLIRRAAIDSNIPLFTNARLATAFIKAFCSIPQDEIPVKSWDEYK